MEMRTFASEVVLAFREGPASLLPVQFSLPGAQTYLGSLERRETQRSVAVRQGCLVVGPKSALKVA